MMRVVYPWPGGGITHLPIALCGRLQAPVGQGTERSEEWTRPDDLYFHSLNIYRPFDHCHLTIPL
jgi:hypothetical protein